MINTDYIFGKNSVETLLKGNDTVDTLYISNSMERRTASFFEALAKEKAAVVKYLPVQKMDFMVGGNKHQGVIATAAEIEYLSLGDLETFATETENATFLLLDEINDPHNLGAMIRTAYLFGVTAVVIGKRGGCSVTPTAIKASAGAALKTPIVRVSNMGEAVRRLKENMVFVYAADSQGNTVEQMDPSGKIALVMGSEGKGVSPLIKKLCDGHISIEQRKDDTIDSLNVSVAAGIILQKMKRL